MQIQNRLVGPGFTVKISSSNGKNLRLQIGDMVQGTVQALRGQGQVSMLLDGQRVEVFTQLDLSQGQHLELRVADFVEGKAVLKVLDKELARGLGQNRLEAKLTGLLKDMGLAAQDRELAMAQKLIDYRLPLTAANMKAMARGMGQLAGQEERSLDLVALALSKGFPLTEKTLSALAQFFSATKNLAQSTDQILAHMQALLKESSQAQSQVQAQGQSQGLPASPGGGPAVSKGPAESLNLLQELIEGMVLKLDTEGGRPQALAIGNQIKALLGRQADLGLDLGLLGQLLSQKEVPAGAQAPLDRLLADLGLVEKELLGQSLANLPAKSNPPSSPDIFYLAFPIRSQGQRQLCQLKIKKESEENQSGEKELGQARAFRLTLSLETAQLGPLVFDLGQGPGQDLSLAVKVEEKKGLDLLEERLPGLIEDLEKKDYRLSYRGISLSDQSGENPRASLLKEKEAGAQLSIDLWV